MKCNIQSAPVKDWVWTVEEIVDIQKSGHLRVNPEYQRGAVWSVPQMRMLIDSLLRGYCIPFIYLLRVDHKTARTRSVHHEVIDGQQRINAICSFIEGFVVQAATSTNSPKSQYQPQYDAKGEVKPFGALYDSQGKDRKRFPAFMHEQECWWGGKKFTPGARGATGAAFTLAEQRKFLETKIPVAIIEECEQHEPRDMFIRLQSGANLRLQEKRDAWPGNFCELVIETGGKEHTQGHPFFSRAFGSFRVDRGQTREIAAEMLMVFLNRRTLDKVALGAEALNDCYREYVGLDLKSPEVKRFNEVLDRLAEIFTGSKSRLVRSKNYAIHLMLFVDSLLKAAPEKIGEIGDAFGLFRGKVSKVEVQILPEDADDDARELWGFYKNIGVRGSTTSALVKRHTIFVRQMSKILGISTPPLYADGEAERKGGGTHKATKTLEGNPPSLTSWEIDELTNERKGGLLFPNREYQRGPVWDMGQRRWLIDSVMRNYQIPLIYLHKVQESGAHARLGKSEQLRYEIIDGQQRIDSFRYFRGGMIPGEGGLKDAPFLPLFVPCEHPGMFPEAAQKQECKWAGKVFDSLGEMQSEFLHKRMAVVEVVCKPDSAKDMYIRLQGGTPLKPQEVRDAWPGEFCRLVLRIGGKEGSYPGHEFFRTKVKASGAVAKRQLAAQLLMLYISRRQNAAVDFVTVDSAKLDDYYREKVDLNLDLDEVRRFDTVLGKLTNLFAGAKTPQMKNAEVIHLVLFADMLMGNYTPAWEDGIVEAHKKFAGEVAKADVARRTGNNEGVPPDFLEYSEDAARSTTKAPSMRRRHAVYVRAMFDFMGDAIQRKDPKRAYTDAEREYIFHRDGRRCKKCGKEVSWSDAEIHHKKPHSEGGQTTLENGVLMCRECHRDLHAKQSKGGE